VNLKIDRSVEQGLNKLTSLVDNKLSKFQKFFFTLSSLDSPSISMAQIPEEIIPDPPYIN